MVQVLLFNSGEPFALGETAMLARRFQGSNSTVLAAMSLDERGEEVALAAANLCRATGMALRLVHVSEPWAGRYWATAIAGGVPTLDMVQAIEQEQVEAAVLHLRKVAQKHATGITCTINVMVGIVADSILADAHSTGATVILTSSSANLSKLTPKGFSTALSLMAYSTVPVVVIPVGKIPDFKKTGFSIVLADDLGAASEGAVAIAFDFGAALKKPDLWHVHVNGMTNKDFEVVMQTVGATAHLEGDGGVDGSEMMEMLTKKLGKKLETRAKYLYPKLDEAGGACHVKVLNGLAADELTKFSKEKAADLVVFGRHQTFHRKPFFVGRIPFYSMLAQDCAVMVVPSL